ncbi:TioE family transcriptional regulator [Streptomyces sp. CBMA123]|uniref:TioE family transcriptional regulator n=1 Tax=Streptomyces sp. CBMA123 TaxID=1896313 RepID=UPI001661E791|nr:TioE family transcriptional regulator [Streptomyces sp. CBMA123]MBD0694145.1 MerR family transcriptional regulator [Streptomyces sp. CBMA123]
MRPADLAREHGISTQAVRNYERDGFLPPAERTPSGYRIYTERHAAALRAFLTLVPAFGHATAGLVMAALHTDRPDEALTAVDRGHAQLLRDRETLAAVRRAVDHLTSEHRTSGRQASDHQTSEQQTSDHQSARADARRSIPGPLSIGELAHRLGLTPATLRTWETAGILTPARERPGGRRLYHPDDTRDAELAHLLRRGGYPLDHIATVIRQVRTAGGTDSLAEALDGWQRRLTARGRAMLTAAARLDAYLSPDQGAPDRNVPGTRRQSRSG